MSFGDFYIISGILYNIYLIFKKIKNKNNSGLKGFISAG